MNLRGRALSFLVALACLAASVGAAVAQASRPAPALQQTPALLLIASRQLTHPGFRESVVLVTRHGRGGPIGIIVNRPLDFPLARIFPALPAAEKHHLHEGGPVEPRQLSYLFRGGPMPADSLQVAEQTYLARNQSLLGDLLRGARPHSGLRVVAGYAGWAPGQLEHEIARGDWLVLPVDAESIFGLPPATLWQELFRRASQVTAASPPAAPTGSRSSAGRDHGPMLHSAALITAQPD